MFTEDAIIFCDADSLFFRPAAAVSKDGLKRNWKSDIRKAINHTINTIKRECMSDKIMHAVKGKGNFRHGRYKDYNANRKELNDDLRTALNYGHGYMCDKHGAVMADDMEADDLVCIWAHEAIEENQDYYIAGIDKDLLQIPGNHFNFVKSTHVYVDHDAGHLNLMRQCLTGDTADNIPGIKGIGPKKAEKILNGIPSSRQWSRVRAAWRGHNAGDPTISRRLLELLTSWEEYETIRSKAESESVQREQDVLSGEE